MEDKRKNQIQGQQNQGANQRSGQGQPHAGQRPGQGQPGQGTGTNRPTGSSNRDSNSSGNRS